MDKFVQRNVSSAYAGDHGLAHGGRRSGKQFNEDGSFRWDHSFNRGALFIKKTALLFVLAGAAFILPEDGAYAGAKIEPVAQIYKIQGEVAVKRESKGENEGLQKGHLVGSRDLLILGKNSSVGLYFKKGGKREINAEKPVSYKVGDLSPQLEAYENTVPAFGGTRGIVPPEFEENFEIRPFYYPQETVIIDSLPMIELKIFGAALHIPKATIEILEGERLLHSKQFYNLTPGAVYTYQSENLAGGQEYSIHVKPDINEIPDEKIIFTSDFYLAGVAGPDPASDFEAFDDKEYKSLEYTFLEQKENKYGFWFIKQLNFNENSRPVISIEILVR